MSVIERREFLRQSASVIGSAALMSRGVLAMGDEVEKKSAAKILRATDLVTLGKTGIKTSRLALGTGSNGAEQRALGVEGLARLLHDAYERGIRWWETADLYGTHPHVAAALKKVDRDRVTITTKVLVRDQDGDLKSAADIRADIERFLKELDTDFIDVLLLHCMSTSDWTDQMEGPMKALIAARKRGHIRAIGCSLHNHDPRDLKTLGPMKAAVDTGWGDIFLVRLNPEAVNMDVNDKKDIPKIEAMFRAMHDRGKVLYGMKVLGGANPHQRKSRIQGDRIDASLRFILGKSYISGFTIGISRERDLVDILGRIERLRLPAHPRKSSTS